MAKNKLVALLGAALGVVLVGGTASAAPSTDANDNITTPNNTNISVTNVASTDTFKACKIINTKYNSSAHTIYYEFGSSWAGFIASAQGSSYASLMADDYSAYADGGSKTTGRVTGNTDIDNLAGALANYLRAHNSYSADGCSDMTVSGTTASLAVGTAGAYLILPTSTSNVYSAMVANVDVVTENSDYVVDTTNASIVAKKSAPYAVVKTSGSNTTFGIGADIPFVVEATIPGYPDNTKNSKVIITDVPHGNIYFSSITAIKENGVALTIDGTNIKKNGVTIGTAVISSSSLVVTLNEGKSIGSPITVEYVGSISTAAKAGASLTNTATLTFMKDVYNSDVTSTNQASVTDTTTVKTLGLKVQKLDENDSPLSEPAEFTLYTDANHTNAVSCQTNPTGVSGTPTTTITTSGGFGETGMGYCRGIAAGTYYLVETKPPFGYKQKSGHTVVTISEANATDGISGNPTVTSGYYTVSVSNEENDFALPFTGGRGVLVYAITGVGIVSIASVYYYRKKKSQA